VILAGSAKSPGILVSGVLIGLVNRSAVASSYTAGNILLAVMIAVLIFRPLGLFGRAAF